MKFLYFHCPVLMSFLKCGWQIIEILVLSGVHVLLMLFVCTCIYVHWCPTRFPYQMMFGRLTITRRVSPVEEELLTPSKHSSALLLYVGFVLLDILFSMRCFVDNYLSLFLFSVGQCFACFSSIYGFWLPLLVSSTFSWHWSKQFLLTGNWIFNMTYFRVSLNNFWNRIRFYFFFLISMKLPRFLPL